MDVHEFELIEDYDYGRRMDEYIKDSNETSVSLTTEVCKNLPIKIYSNYKFLQ